MAAYILSGGRSLRFGRDKARAVVESVPLIVRLADTITRASLPVTVVAARAGAYADLGLRTIGDIVPGKGPLGGLWTALEDVGGNGWVFVSACDWVGARTEWISRLSAETGEPAGAILFVSDPPQPLFALYHTSILETVARRVRSGRLAMHELLEEIPVRKLPAPRGWKKAINLNRPIDEA